MGDFETYLDAQSELDAINDLLAAIGEPPVNSLDEQHADLKNARRILHSINKTVQSTGWTFNIEEGATLRPEVNSLQIPYLQTYLRMTGAGGAGIYTNRGGFVYDRTANTDEFTGPITVDLVRARDFYEMPTCFRDLIVSMAAARFNRNFFGSQEVAADLNSEIAAHRIACNEFEMDYGRYNMLDGDAFVQGILQR